MSIVFKISPCMALILLSLVVGSQTPAAAAGGSAIQTTTPDEQAAEAYNRGIDFRDKAWEFERQAGEATSAAESEKYRKKAQKEYKKAIRAFDAAVDLNPSMHQAYSSLGYALRSVGNYGESLKAYNKALDLVPDYAEAVEYRAEAYLGLDQLEPAKEAYLQLFRSDRERADVLMEAMQKWVTEHRANAAGVDPSLVEQFAAWVEERVEVAGNVARLDDSEERDW